MQIKRFVASSLAALMAGATFAGAALAATSVGGVLKTLGSQAAAGTPYLVVVGDTAAASDVVGAIDVASALAQQVTKEVAVPGVSVATLTGGVSLDTADTKLYLGDVVGKARPTVTENELPVLLASGSVQDEDLNTYEYLQYLSFPREGEKYKITYEQEYASGGLKDPVYKIVLGTSPSSTNYFVKAWVSFNKPLDATKAIGKELTLFGKKFVISGETTSDQLVLFGVSQKTEVEIGETKTITVGTKDYNVEMVGISSNGTTAVIKVNGVVYNVKKGDSYNLGEASLYVHDVSLFKKKDPTTGKLEETARIEISIGTDRYILKQGEAIKQGPKGREVEIKGTNVGTLNPRGLSKIEIYFDGYSDATSYLKAGSEFTVPVFGFKVRYEGPAPIPSETITISPGGSLYYQLSFTDKFGKSGTITWAYYKEGYKLADSDGNQIAVVEGTPLTTSGGGYRYTIVNAGGFPHLLKLISLEIKSSQQYCKAEFQDVLSGATYKFERSNLSGELTIDGQDYSINCDAGNNNVVITWSPSGAKVVFPTLETKYGAKIALVNPGANQFTVAANGALNIILPTGSITVEDKDSTSESYDLKVTKINGVSLNNPIDVIASDTNYDVVKVGNVYYALREPATPNGTLYIGLDDNQNNDNQDNVLGVPAVLLIEEPLKGESDGNVAIFPVTYDSASSEQKLKLGFTNPIYVKGIGPIDTSLEKVKHYVTAWGTKVVYDVTGAGTATITYPDSQVYHLVAVGENPSWTTAATEAGTYKTYAPLSLPVAKLASEVTAADKTNANIVLVGGPCANSLVQALVDAGKLDASMTCAGGNPGPAWTPGAAYVKVVEDAFTTGKVALVVAGTNAADTRLATSLLSQGKLEDQTASGVKVSGTVTAPVVTPM
ncbi:MAG: S-layer protein [Candidatus Aenigmarchaeota archaeon]|nr:S-layer protein [Candidatus Aenigmarchaeota archaeon]